MDVDKKVEFKFGGSELTFARMITYHDHLYRVQKALWPQICTEVQKISPVTSEGVEKIKQSGGYDHLDGFYGVIEGVQSAAKKNEFFITLGGAVVEALVNLGYDKKITPGLVHSWVNDTLLGDGVRAMFNSDVYGPKRYGPPKLTTAATFEL